MFQDGHIAPVTRKNRQGQLGESLQHHQDLLGALDRDEGTGYGSGPALPPLKIHAAPGAAIRKPPKPPALGRRSREEAEKMEEQQEEATFFLFDQTCVVLMFFLMFWGRNDDVPLLNTSL